MYIEKFKHEGVKTDGTFENALGAVETDGVVRMSTEDEFFISIIAPRDQYGTVEGMQVVFDTRQEMENFLAFHEVY